MYKILFVEDQKDAVIDAKELLEKSAEHFCKICDFHEAENYVLDFSPDVIVLDLLKGATSSGSVQEGRKTLELIWKLRFCPIIFYSAEPGLLDDDRRVREHPFIKRVQKGGGSPKLIEKTFGEFKGHIDAMKSTKFLLDQAFHVAIRDLAELVFKRFSNNETRDELLKRCGLRRVSALIDCLDTQKKICSWEQFVFPPIGESIMLGDIIRVTSDNSGQATSFRVVLTPSCDLAMNTGRKNNVRKALVAKCFQISELKARTDLCKLSKGKKKKDLKDILITNVLSKGFYQKMLVIPNLPGVIPDMVANLKELEFVSISNISTDGKKKFVRVASVDSPFRELVSWAYMQISCRPGLPDRDFVSWFDQIYPQL